MAGEGVRAVARAAGGGSVGSSGTAGSWGSVEERRHGREYRLYELAGRLTERDRSICHLLYEHRVLTTGQVRQVAFGSLRKAQERLSVLYRLEVVDRFRLRSWSGSGPFHFTLGPAGASVVAAERGVSPSDLGWQRGSSTALAANRQLAHLVGCNGVFTALVASASRQPAANLAEWWSARRCAAAWGDAVRPDGYGVWVEDAARLPFLLEYDTGSEALGRLEGKLPGYARLARAVGHPTWVLFCFSSPGRERTARAVLVHPEVPVATAVVRPDSAPDGPLWRAIGDTGQRLRLADIGHPSRALGQRPARRAGQPSR
jgi:hypothetical protein